MSLGDAVGWAFGLADIGFLLAPIIKEARTPDPKDATLVKVTLGSTGIQGDTGNMQGNIP